VQCDRCDKWRRVAPDVADALSDEWHCGLSKAPYAYCCEDEEPLDEDEIEMARGGKVQDAIEIDDDVDSDDDEVDDEVEAREIDSDEVEARIDSDAEVLEVTPPHAEPSDQQPAEQGRSTSPMAATRTDPIRSDPQHPAAHEPPPPPTRQRYRVHDRVRVLWPSGEELIGRVLEVLTELGGRRSNTTAHRYRVSKTSDSALGGTSEGSHWHLESEITELLPAEAEDEEVVAEGWEQLQLRCSLSLMPLTDPAKAAECTHRALCNYGDLRECISRTKRCPVCTIPIPRTHGIERDHSLRAALEALPRGIPAAWISGTQVRVTPPPLTADRQRQRPQHGASSSSSSVVDLTASERRTRPRPRPSARPSRASTAPPLASSNDGVPRMR